MKGQVAIEYLTTYGWAILLLVVVIGVVLTSFSPSFLISEQCTIDKNNLPCNAQVYNDGEELIVAFKIINGFGYPIEVKEVNASLPDGTEASPVTISNTEKLNAGGNITVFANFYGKKKPVNDLVTVNVQLVYVSCAQEINPECDNSGNMEEHTKSGKIISRVTD